MITIKEIRKDSEEIDNLLSESKYTKDSLLSFISNPDNYLLVGYVDNRIAGILEAYNLQKLDKRNKEMLLYSIETKEEYRRMGVARALILHLRDIAIREGCHEIWVLTEKDNVKANGFKVNGKDKRARLDSVTYMIRSGKVLFPKEGSKELIQQLVYFGVEKHDDLVDAFTIVLHQAVEMDRPNVKVLSRDVYEAFRGGSSYGSNYWYGGRVF
jgi:GNAT superfamily N-acetyltransferase